MRLIDTLPLFLGFPPFGPCVLEEGGLWFDDIFFEIFKIAKNDPIFQSAALLLEIFPWHVWPFFIVIFTIAFVVIFFIMVFLLLLDLLIIKYKDIALLPLLLLLFEFYLVLVVENNDLFSILYVHFLLILSIPK